MIMRTASMAGMALCGLGFMAGAAAGFGLGATAVGAACLARQAWKRRNDWPKPDTVADAAMPEEGEAATA